MAKNKTPDWLSFMVDIGQSKNHWTAKISLLYCFAFYDDDAVDSAFSLVKSRLALGSPNCLFVFSPPRLKWPNTHPYVKPFSRLEKGIIGPASLLHGWHWVLFCIGTAYIGTRLCLRNESEYFCVGTFVCWMARVRQKVDVWYDEVSWKGKGEKRQCQKRTERAQFSSTECVSQLAYWGCTYAILSLF